MKSPDRVLALVVAAFLWGGSLASQERLSSPEYHAVGDALTCQCGCGLTISNCGMENCHSAEPIREEIASRLLKGESVESVIEVFKERYGLVILSAPPKSGFHWVAWLTPVVALAVGLIVVLQVLRSWRRKTPAAAASEGSSQPAVSDAQRARIERELRDFSN
jgi:cytochrome c-type biogenesis protein CcmH/NrfF